MDDFDVVQVLHASQNLIYVVSDLHFSESLSPTQLLINGLVDAHFKHDLDVFVVLEVVVEMDDMMVVQGTVDADFAHQFLFGPCLS